MENLERRVKMLEERIDLYDEETGDPSRTYTERNALQFAIDRCKEWMAADPLIDFDWTACEFTDTATVEDARGMVGQKGMLMGRPVTIVDALLVEPKNGRKVIKLTLERSETPTEWAPADFVLIKMPKTN